MNDNILLVFARNPVYGQVKTRLAATIGNDRALLVYQKLVEHTVHAVKKINAGKLVCYSNFVVKGDAWDDAYLKTVQRGSDLGERMSNAFNDTFKAGSKKAVIIGTDCYELTNTIIANAFIELSNYDVVIGPALDGGYYLLGMNTYHPELFEQMTWSTDTVSTETLARCSALGLSFFLLAELADIDEEKDLINTDILNQL